VGSRELLSWGGRGRGNERFGVVEISINTLYGVPDTVLLRTTISEGETHEEECDEPCELPLQRVEHERSASRPSLPS
jgi:hypothetical protein